MNTYRRGLVIRPAAEISAATKRALETAAKDGAKPDADKAEKAEKKDEKAETKPPTDPNK